MKYTVLAVGPHPAAVRRRRRALPEHARRPRARSTWSRCATTSRSSAGSRRAATACCSTSAGARTTRRRSRAGSRSAAGGGRDVCFVIGGPYGHRARALRRAALVRPDDVPAPARPRDAARAALPRAQDPGGRAVPSLSPDDSPRTTCGPPSQAAAGDLRDGGARRGDRLTLERPQEGRLRRLLDQRRDAARARAGRAAAGDRRAARRGAAGAARRARRQGRGRRARASSTSSWPTPGTWQAVDAVLAAGDALRRRRRSGERDPGRVRLGQPDRPADRGQRAATPRSATRSRGSSSSPATTVEREYYFNDCGGQVQRLGAVDPAPARAARSRPRTATRASTSPSWRRGSRTRPSKTRRRARAPRASAILMAGIRDDARALPRALRPLVPRGARSTRATRARGTARARSSLAERPLLPQRGRAVAAHDGAAATTRTACSCARPASRRTSPPTSPTTGTSSTRGFDRLINVLGADHHGYVARLEGRRRRGRRRPGPARGPDAAVRPRRRGRRARVDVQAPRRLRHARRADRGDRRRRHALVHALALGRLDRRPRPHAGARSSRPRTPSTTSSTRTRGSPRCCARPATERVAAALAAPREGLALEPAERELVKKLLAFPAEVAEAAERRAPHRIAAYALETAQAFTAFYRDCRVVGAEPEALESFRHRAQRGRRSG